MPPSSRLPGRMSKTDARVFSSGAVSTRPRTRGAIAAPPDASRRPHLAARPSSEASTRKTWSTVSVRHRPASRSIASACVPGAEARSAALMAPAEMPVRIGKSTSGTLRAIQRR